MENVTDDRAMHIWKAEASMAITEDGIVIAASEPQLAKAA
jgi:hypothetical protein